MSPSLRDRFNSAVALHRSGNLDAAEEAYRELIACAPQIDRTYGNLVTLLRSEGRYAEAESTCRSWLLAHPHSSQAKYRLGILLLRRGAYAEGWEFYEHRTEIDEHGIVKPHLSTREWKGEKISRLLIWYEQGFGDHFQFGRYLPILRREGVTVSLVVKPALGRVFDTLCDHVCLADEAAQLPPHDAWCLIGSLPHLVGGFPPAHYLPGKEGGEGIGVVCRGNVLPDPRRTLDADATARLLALPGAVDLMPEATGARDFADTAKIIAGLSEVVSIDTAVAHLALAMGKPTTVLLPADACWRWGDQQDHCPLYPAAHLLRQTRPTDWRSVVDEVLKRVF